MEEAMVSENDVALFRGDYIWGSGVELFLHVMVGRSRVKSEFSVEGFLEIPMTTWPDGQSPAVLPHVVTVSNRADLKGMAFNVSSMGYGRPCRYRKGEVQSPEYAFQFNLAKQLFQDRLDLMITFGQASNNAFLTKLILLNLDVPLASNQTLSDIAAARNCSMPRPAIVEAEVRRKVLKGDRNRFFA